MILHQRITRHILFICAILFFNCSLYISSFTLCHVKSRSCRPNKNPSQRSTKFISYSSRINDNNIEYQSDSSQFGRGDMHLSAVLNEKDVVVYQIGTWEVDGVEVGDGNPASFKYCVIETMQVVWTHNCEHGFIRGLSVNISVDDCRVNIVSPLEFVDFGPEQLVARLPVNWISDDEAEVLATIPLELLNQ